MSENKFIKHLRGKSTTGSLVELQNQNTPASFADMPQGTSNPNVKYSDHRGNATVVAKGTQNWKLSGSSLLLADTVNGDGRDYTSEFQASGSGLWINSTYTFPTTGDANHPVAAIFNTGTKWVLKLCGHNLLSDHETIDFTLLVKIGSTNVMTKAFTVKEKAFHFCEEFIIDYEESAQSLIKAQGGSTLTVQLLCADSTASATIYNGMTVLTALQRGVDASTVSASFANVEEVMRDGMLPNDYFNNAAYIDQVEDGEEAYAVFTRDGDEINLSGWTPKEEIARREEVIIKADVMPTPSADLAYAIYQYTGATSGMFEHGYIYECKGDVAYDGVIYFEPHKVVFDTDVGTLTGFFEEWSISDYQTITHGTMTYAQDGDIWALEGLDENNNIVFTGLQLYTQDLIDSGFVFINPMSDYSDGEVIDFDITWTEVTNYGWERIDVQPGGSRGRFLALWNCATGLAESNPPISPYEYKTGDYFIVGTVSNTTNYKPDGASYVIGTASTTVETNEVAVDDTYFFDGTTWKLQSNSNKTVSFSAIAGDIYDNASATTALNRKVSKSGDTMTGELIMNYTNAVSFRNNNASARHYFKADGQDLLELGTSRNTNIKLKWEATSGNLYSAVSTATLGISANKWANVYTTKINNGADITVPSVAGTMALTSDIPTVNDATLTIQKNGTDVATFTANSSTNTTANITVPTKVSDLTNDSGFISSASVSTLTDVTLTNLSDGDALVYDANSQKWVNGNGGVSASYDAQTKTITFA